jgi:hypothetical protein
MNIRNGSPHAQLTCQCTSYALVPQPSVSGATKELGTRRRPTPIGDQLSRWIIKVDPGVRQRFPCLKDKKTE